MSFSFEQKRGYASLLIVFAAVLWGTMPLFVTRLSALSLSSGEMLFYRAFLGALLMGGFMLCKDRSLFRIRLRDIWIFFGSGVLSFAAFSAAYAESIQRSSPAVAAALLYTSPAFLVVLSRLFFKERLTPEKCLAVLFVIGGAMTVSGLFFGGVSSPAGILFGLFSGLGYSLYTVFSRVGLRRYKTVTVTFYTFVCATAASLPFVRVPTLEAGFASLDGFLFMLLYAAVTAFLPYITYTAGLRATPPAVAGILATLEPVVAALFGVWLLHEPMTPYKCIGILLILCGVLLPELASIRERKPIPQNESDRKEL